jgi:hypothetical protein
MMIGMRCVESFSTLTGVGNRKWRQPYNGQGNIGHGTECGGGLLPSL